MPNIVKFRAWTVVIKGIKQIATVLSDKEVDLSVIRPTADFYDNEQEYLAGAIVQVRQSATVGGVTTIVGTFVARQYVPAFGTGNQVPQYPYPNGVVSNIFWMLVALGPQQINICRNGSSSIYVNSSESF